MNEVDRFLMKMMSEYTWKAGNWLVFGNVSKAFHFARLVNRVRDWLREG